MYVKTIKYTDFLGVEREEDFHFHYSKAEITEKQLSTSGGFAEMIFRIVKAQNHPELYKVFKELVLDAYGEISPDGRKFIKVDANGRRLSDDFAQTEAYSQMMTEFTTDDKAAIEFFEKVFPVNEVAKPAAVAPAAL